MSLPRLRFASGAVYALLLMCTGGRAQLFTQQGGKLVPSDATSYAQAGSSVAISANGSTAVLGGWSDNGWLGAAWIFTRDGNGNWSQQGRKLVGSGAAYSPSYGVRQGFSVALSANGSTALIGGPDDNSEVGAAWVLTRDSNGNWSQQGSKLVGTGAIGPAGQGVAVALSADGNTALIGGCDDNNFFGAVWVFTRDASGTWTQQGSKLVGSGAAYNTAPNETFGQGYAVALSGDGNTALESSLDDNGNAGAVWVFTRDNSGNWTQQGTKLVASDTVGTAAQGSSVALSRDGNTALEGGTFDDDNGATWVFTRDSDGNWTEQSKLVGTGAVSEQGGGAFQGWSLGLAADGNTALVGGPYDNYVNNGGEYGAAWVFTRDSNGNWSQLGTKLAGTGAVGRPGLGTSAALSADGNTALLGGPFDNGSSGTAWVFVRAPASFSLLAGALNELSVGADGSVWGINSTQQIFTYNFSSQSWTNIPGSLTQIAVGSSNAVWGLNEYEQIYHWDAVHSQWINILGSLAQIAVGADGDVWGLNSASSIYHYNAQTGFFVPVPGQLAHIAVGSAGAVYGINGSGGAFWYNPGTGSFEYLGGPAFTQIAVGADGYVVGLSNGIGYGYQMGAWYPVPSEVAIAQLAVGSGASIYVLDAAGNIYFYNGQSRAMVQIPGTLNSIAVAANGTVWGINGLQEIFTFGAPTRPYETVAPIQGLLQQMSVGADGSVWGVSANTLETFNPAAQQFEAVSGAPGLAQISVGAGGEVWGLDAAGNIYQWDASSATFNNIPGQLTFIQAAANGSVWGINAAGQIYTYSNNSWRNIPGTLASLSVGADGTVWGINAQQQIYRFEGGSWVNVLGSLTQISVGDANNIWGINAQSEVYYYDHARGWVIIPGAYLTDISAAFDGAVWGVNAAGNLYQWNAGTQSFNFVGSGVTNIAVGNAAAVWGLNANSGAVVSWF